MGVGAITSNEIVSRASARRARVSATPLILGGLVLAGSLVRFYGLNRQGYWYDEANTVYLLHFDLGKMLGLLSGNESTPPLYYCLAWLWTRVFGLGEAGLRSLSALFGVLVIPTAYLLGRTAATRRVGLVLAAVVAFNPLLIWYSQEARAYELLVLISALSLVAMLRARTESGPRMLVAWAISSALALVTHYYAVLAVVPAAALLLAEQRRRRATQLAVAFVAVCGAALIPLAIAQNNTHRDRWISRGPIGLRLSQIIPQFLIGPGSPERLAVKFCAFAVGLAALVLLAIRADPRERRPALTIGGLIVGALLLNALLIAAGYDDLITRNLLALVVPALLVLACGLGARRAGRLGLAAAAVLCALGLTAAIGVASDYSLQRPDWRPLVRLLGPPPRGPGRAFIIQHYRMLLPMSLYMPGLRRIDPRVGAVVNQIDVIALDAPLPTQRMCWWGAACNLRRTVLQTDYPLRGFHVAWRRTVLQFTVEHFVSDHPIRIRSRTVAPALTETNLGRDDLLYQH